MASPRLSGSLLVCLPGPLAMWCYGLVDHVAAKAGVSVRQFDRADDIAAGKPANIYMCQFPSLSAIDAVRDGRLNAVFVAQDPIWNVAEAIQAGKPPLEAIRAITASATANLAIGSTSRSRLACVRSAPSMTDHPNLPLKLERIVQCFAILGAFFTQRLGMPEIVLPVVAG